MIPPTDPYEVPPKMLGVTGAARQMQGDAMRMRNADTDTIEYAGAGA